MPDSNKLVHPVLNAGNIGLDIDEEEERPEKSKHMPSDEKNLRVSVLVLLSLKSM